MKIFRILSCLVLFTSSCVMQHSYLDEISMNVERDDSKKTNAIEIALDSDIGRSEIDRLIINDPSQIIKCDTVIYLLNFNGIKDLSGLKKAIEKVALESSPSVGFVFLDDHDDYQKFKMLCTIFKLPNNEKRPYILAQKRNVNSPIIIQVNDKILAMKELSYIIENKNEKWENLMLALKLSKSRNSFGSGRIDLNEIFVREYNQLKNNTL